MRGSFYQRACDRRSYDAARLKHWLFWGACVFFAAAIVCAFFREWGAMGFFGIATQIGAAFGSPMSSTERRFWTDRLGDDL